MDCPHKIPPSGTPAIHHKPPRCPMTDQIPDTTVRTETGKANPDHNLIFEDITAQVITIHTEAAQGHDSCINAATTGAAHDDHIPPI